MRYLFPLSPTNQQRQYEKLVWVYPAHLAMYATFLKQQGHEVIWDAKITKETTGRVITNDTQIEVPFDKLPFPDREFTDAMNPRYQSYGNYKFKPATHMMSSNLCWYGKCTFCIDTKKLEEGEGRGIRSVDHVMAEIDNLIANGYKEVFDDSGTFPIGKWLAEFCMKMRMTNIRTGKRRCDQITIGCNMRVQELEHGTWRMMYEAGFRFILFGVESANQITLDKIKKAAKSEDIIPVLKEASEAGLEPHGTFMTGYEWETQEDENKTIQLCHYLLRKGFLKTAQASVYSLPRTLPASDSRGHEYLPKFYDVYRQPEFLIRKICDIKRWQDFTYLVRGARLVVEEKVRKLWRNK